MSISGRNFESDHDRQVLDKLERELLAGSRRAWATAPALSLEEAALGKASEPTWAALAASAVLFLLDAVLLALSVRMPSPALTVVVLLLFPLVFVPLLRGVPLLPGRHPEVSGDKRMER